MDTAIKENRARHIFGLGFGLLAAGIISTGFLAYRHYEQHYRREVEQTLSAVADLKVGELMQYREERLGDGGILFQNATLTAWVRRFVAQPQDAESRRQILDWISRIREHYHYDQARLLDAQGVTRLVLPEQAEPDCPFLSQRVAEALRSGKVALQDFYRDEHDQQVYLAVMVPIRDETKGGQPLWVLALRIDPRTFLFPFLKRWPTSSQTAETLLFRREGNDALFLNEPKFGTNTALGLRVSLARREVVAVQAVLGQEGIVEGLDYRGIPVLAGLRAVPDSPWFLVARMDSAEVFAALRERRWMMIGTVAALLLGAGAGLGWLWRRQSSRFFRKQYEAGQALQASEDRFRLVMEATRDGVWDWDITTGAMYYSPAYLGMLGFRPEEVSTDSHSWQNWIHPEDLEKALRRHQDCIENRGDEFHFEARMRSKQGEWRWILSRGKCVARDAQGRAQRLVGSNVDITERKRMEAELRENEARFRELFEHSPDAVFVEDASGVVLDVNPAACRLHGLSREELLGKNVTDLVPPESREEVRARFPQWFRQELTVAEGVSYGADGRLVMVDITGTPIRYRGQTAVLLHVRDITERKKMEEALRANQAELECILAATGDGILAVDRRGRTIHCNQRFGELWQIPRELLDSRDDQALLAFVKDQLTAPETFLRKVEQLYESDAADMDTLTFKDGKVLERYSFPLKLADSFVGRVWSFRDITERQRAAEALRLSEEEFRLVLEYSSDAIFWADATTGLIVRCNRKTEELTECPRAELIGLHVEKLHPLGPDYHEIFRRLAAMPATENVETEFISRTGKRTPVVVNFSVVTIGPERIVQGIARDMTEHRQAEATLRESEERHRTTLQTAMDGFWLVDVRGCLREVNAAYCQMSGYSAAELLALRVTDLESKETAADTAAHIEKIVTRGRDRFESRHRRKDGSIFDVEVSVQHRATEGGQMVVFLRDITERKQAEEALRLSVEEFRLVLEHSSDAIFWADAATGCIVRCNRKTEELTECPRGELIGMHVEKLHPPGPDYHEIFRRLAAVPATENVETEFISQPGKRTPVVVNFSVVTIGRTKIVQGIARDITERKRAEEALRLAAEQRRLALAAGNLGTWDYDFATRTGFWDERCRAIVGVTAAEKVRFSTATALMHEEDRLRMERTIQEALRPDGSGVYAAEYRVVWPDGTVRWVASNGQAFFQGEGEARQVVRFIGTLSDITNAKQAQSAVRESEQQFRLVLEHSNDAIFWADAETGILVRCNRKAEELTGRTRAELIGMHQKQLHPAELGYTEVFRKAAALASMENIEAIVLSATGKRTPVVINTSVVTLGSKRIMQGIFHDITNRKQAEEALRQAHDDLEVRVQERTAELRQTNESLYREIRARQQMQTELAAAEVRYRTVADFTHDWEYWETSEFCLEYCSPSCERITGYLPGDFIAEPRLLQWIIHPEDLDLWLKYRQTEPVARGGSPVVFRIRRKDGRIRWMEHVGQRVFDKDGRFQGLRASNRDITDRKEKELEFQKLREALAYVTRVTTAGQFAASLAHELNQPLTAILSNAQAAERFLATSQPDLAEVQEALREIRADSQRAGSVIHGLRAMFQRTGHERGAVRLNEVIQETADLLRSEFVLKETSLQLELAPELPTVWGNHTELQQVVLNMMVNALEAMTAVPPIARRLQVRTRLADAARIEISLRDSGPGIAAAQFLRLFEPFVTTKATGMGMGLAICQSIIQAHAGHLQARNNLEGGATFEFTLSIHPAGANP